MGSGCSTYNVGLSLIAGNTKKKKMEEDKGLYIEISDSETIKTPIVLGVLKEGGIKNFRIKEKN